MKKESENTKVKLEYIVPKDKFEKFTQHLALINELLEADINHCFKIYDRTQIQKVYKRHHDYCGTVLYSMDKGYTWQSVGMDSGKWDLDWLFAFISLK